MIFGTSFSHSYLRDHFQLLVEEAFAELLNLKLGLVRLSCYWNETEREVGKDDLSQLEKLLVMAEKAQQTVVVTIGMKAIRWPEFYIPQWTSYEEIIKNPKALFSFLEKVINMATKFSCVKYLQIENEPLDKSGPRKLTIPVEILQQEVSLTRQLSDLPIVLTAWGNKSLKDNRLTQLAKLADIIGLDFYCQIPDGSGGYWGPDDNTETLKQIINSLAKPVWITELQTNPWKDSPELTQEKIMATNLEFARELPVEAILFWGYEYRYSQKELKPQLLLDYQPNLF